MEQNPFDQFDAPASTSAANPFDQFDEVKESSVTRRALGDTGVSLLKGAIAVPEAAVGIADIATGGRAGKVAEGLGFRPKEAKEILNEYYSPEQKAANQKLSEAEGFVDNVKTAVQNPSTILQAGVESVPLIAGGGVVGLGARALKATPVIAGAIGEGAVGAGMAAEGIRQETDDGLLSAKQSGIAALSGLGTAAFGAAGGKLAQKLGIGDIDTIASGGASPATNKGFARKLVEGGIAEGVFEELPQSVQEQMLSNYALDKPLTEGVDKAAAMGLLTGSAMGAAVGALTGGKDKLVIDQSGLEADAALAEQKQAEYDAQQSTQPEPDEFTNFTQQVDADIEQRKIAAGIKNPTEAIPASDILGDENVSTDLSGTTGMVDSGTIANELDNAGGRAVITGDGVNATGSTINRDSAASDIPAGNGNAQNDTVERPFASATDDILPKLRGMTTDAKVIAQIDEELKLRGIANVDSVNTPAERVDEKVKGVHVGEKINKEWTAFSPESGTLNIPRSEMPQVKAEHRGAMVNFMNARGVDHTQETVPASSLKPTQQEFSEAKVKKASKYAGGDRSILVSSDNHVLDGHHQWLSKLNKGGDVDVIRLNAPIAQLLNDVKEFPSSTVESGATAIEPSDKNGQLKAHDEVDYSSMSYEQLQKAREEGRAKNKALDLAVIKKYAGDELANEARSWSQRAIDKWFDKNATAEIENESSAFKGVDVDKIDAYSQAFNNFDETSPQSLGASIALKMRDIDKPDFVGSPEFVTIRNALAYSKEQGWKESDVLDAMRERAESYAGRDAPELFERLFKTKPTTSENGKVAEALPVKEVESTGTTTVPAKEKKPKAPKQYKPKTLLATLRDLGGIALTEKRDVTGEAKGFAPGGYNQVFKSNTTRSLKGLIESGDLDDYLPYNMRLESNGANEDAFDSTEAYDYLADKIRNGESVLPYAVEEEVKANQYYQEVEATAQDILDDFAKNFNEDEINAELQIAGTNEREAFADVQVFKPDSENGDTGSGERSAATTQTNASQQAEVKDSNSDLLGDNTTAKQAIADAERAKDAKRNSGNDNQDTFTLTGSNSEADQAAAAGAQDLFLAPIKQPSKTESSTGADVAEITANQSSNDQANDEVAKATEALTAAGVKGKEKLDTIKDVREGKVTADEVAEAYGEPAAQKPKGKVDDFGEKLEGARKDMVRAMAKEYSDDELASLPISKIWPASDVNLIENKTAAAIAWAAREEIPSKPRKPYAVRTWVGKVKVLRDIGRLVNKALEVNPELMLQQIKDANLGHFKSKVALLEAIDREQWKRIGKVEEYPNAYAYDRNNEKVKKPLVRIDIDGRTNSFEASSVADVIDKVNEQLGVAPQDKRMAFEVRGARGTYFINKKGDKNYTKLKTFDSSKEAFEFLRNNYDEVVAAWDATKDRLNVKESDVRGKENRPRTGEDYRKGKDVSSEEFATTFGFRGIQFGEWVKQGGKDNDRQGALNAAYDALMDLANIINVPPKALSLEGTLGLSFGARGKGSAAAHFEPNTLVINLTKTQGAGTLAHEWFHALDNYFSRKRGGEKSMAEVKSQQSYREGNYITYKPEALYINKNYGNKGITKAELERYRKQSPNSKYWSEENWILDPKHPQGVRPEVEVRFADLVDALNTSPMKQRARSIDGVKEGTDGYWSRIIELGARAFENYVIHKMQLNGYDNDYLANVVRVDSFNRDSSRFPYLLDEEVAPVAEAFDNLFSEIKTKETDSGNVAMFSRMDVIDKGLPKEAIQRAVNVLRRNWKNAPEIIVVQDMSDPAIREAVREENDRQLSQGAEGQPEGFFDAGKVYIVASEMNSPDDLIRVVFHETLGHYGLRGLYGKELGGILDRVAMLRKRDMAKKAKQYGLDLTKKSDVRIIAEEVLAEMAQTAPEAGFVKRAIAAIRQFLRDIGVKLELTDNDIIANYLLPARNFVVNGQNKDGVMGLVAAFVRNNREPSKADGDTFLTAALEFTARNEDLFENAPSDSKEIADIAKDMNTQFRVEPFGKSQTKLDGAEKAWEVFMPNYKYRSAVIYEKGDEVWINVARLQSGENKGNEIYSLAAAYAYNNDKVFIGDPLGLTDKAFYRRAENMLSSALKYGTTKHIEPHVAQTDPDLYYSFDEKTKDFGESVRKINWKKGDDAHNIKELIYTVYNGAITNIPELKNVIFNPTTQGFTTIDGEQFTDKDFARVVSDYYARTDGGSGSRGDDGNTRSLGDNEPKKSNPYRAGVRTAKRAALFNTFLREKSGERRREVLGSYVRELQNRGLADSLKGTFYSRSTIQTETPQFKSWFGNSKVVDADGKPLVVYHGTRRAFDTFEAMAPIAAPGNPKGIYFTSDKSEAKEYAADTYGDMDERSRIVEAYLKIEDDADGIVKKRNVRGDTVYEYIVFNPENIKSAIGNNGDFNPANPDIRFSRSNPQSSLIPKWDAPTESKLDNVVYALQDKNVDLKRVSQAIKKAGTDIADRWNAYLQEELYHGRTAKRTQDFIKNDLEPLIEDMRMRGVGMADFEEYLWARHAEERNIQIAKINPKMPDGGSGMSTQDARDYLANLSPSNKTKYEALARRIDLINRKSRQVLIDYGLESTATIASWESAYKNYVPLMREDMDAGFGNGTGQGFSVKGNSAKRATGSNRAVVDIIANMAQQYEKNVIRGEKNRVSTALIGLAKLNPNPDFWEVDTPPSTKTIVKGKTIYEVLYNGSKVNEFTNKPAANNFIQWNGSSGYTINEVESPEQVEYVTDPNYKNRDNVIVARIVNKLGKVEERSVVFNQFDERAMRMAASLKNLDQDQIGELLGAASGITRYFASVNTQYNPIFGLINITRDVQGALLNLNTTPIANKKKEVLGNTLDALKGIYQDLRSERKNGTPSGNKWSQLFEEFQNEGGQTGYRDMFRNAKERGEALKNALDPLWWQNSKIGKVISLNGTIANQEQWVFDKAIKPIFDWLSDYNNALENAVRLSVYKVALDNGHSKQQAASMAKNISVNFNRKGEMGRQIGSLYAFFNASVQGTARIGETLTSTDKNGKIKLSTIGKRIVQGGLLLGSMQALLLAAAGYDDDEPPEFVRDRSIIVPLDFFGADGKFVTVPMPLGYNAIPSFSRILTEWALSGGENTQERLVHILDMVMNVTNPIGNAGLSLQTIAPTVIDPLAALAENKDFTGRPIAREDFNSLNPTPGFTRAKDTASAISKGLAYGINAITGGTDYKPGEFSPSPDQIDYLIGQVTGGVGREAMKVEQTATALVTGEDLPAYKIPIVGRFYGDATGQSSQGNAFYKNLREINKHENQIKGMIKAGEDPTQYRLDNPESRLITQANYTERAVQKLRKQRRAMLEKGDDPSAIESIDDRITELMLNLNEKVKLRKEMQEG